MDVAFDHTLNGYIVTQVFVSILVLVDVAFDRNINRKWMDGMLVSILVLVDVAFDQEGVEPEDYIYICFNPCFSGCCF